MKVIKYVLLIVIVLLFNLSCTSDSTIDDNGIKHWKPHS